MRMRFLLLLLGLLLVSNGPRGGRAAETCPIPDVGGDDALEENINDTLEAMGTATEKLMEDMKSLDLHLRAEAGEGGDREEAGGPRGAQDGVAGELEREIERLDALAGSDEGKELYEQLQKLNEQLEQAGVKAFGELEEGSYRREEGKGEWVLPALKEDIEACKVELQLQEHEAAAAGDAAAGGEQVGGGGGEKVDEDGSAGLFAELKKLNSELEAAGVKAFGDLEESTYRRGGQGEWVVEALREDIEACKAELAMQEEERAAAGGGEGGQGEAQGGGDECKSCDELDGDIKEAEDEGARLFAELKELNPLVKEEIYFRNGEWRIDTLKYDIQACSGDDGECEAPAGGGGKEGKDVEEGKEERMRKMADLFGANTLKENMDSEEHKREPEGGGGGGDAADDAGCGG